LETLGLVSEMNAPGLGFGVGFQAGRLERPAAEVEPLDEVKRFQRLEKHFQELDALEGEERLRRLALIRDEDPTFAADLDRLLEASRGSGQAAVDQIAELARSMTDPAPLPERVGRYRIHRLLGEGGMGRVFEAEQTEPIRRRVALKLTHSGLLGRDARIRFDMERQALALLDHPHIASILDAGTTEAGQPWFVMDLVDGLPITRFCDQERLTVRDRLRLFLQVCDAVQHAHQKGIIHRDIKPSNVLATMRDGKPFVRVIDFGIAKAIDPDQADVTMLTGQWQMMGTPAYMSPEQAEGSLDIDTRSDIYALGVLLYELLVGVSPFDDSRLQAMSLVEIQRLIREVEPQRPSQRLLADAARGGHLAAARRLDTAGLARALRGELDWIVMRALEKDRTRRYATANALASDLRGHLAGEPVQAAPPSRLYRLKKFIHRHRAQAVAAVLIGLSLIGGMVATAWQAQEAQRNARQAEQVATFLVELFEYSDPARARDGSMTAREMLDEGLQTIEDRLASEPELMAEMLGIIGKIYQNLGLFEQAYGPIQRAVELFEALGIRSPRRASTLLYLANLEYRLGNLETAERVAREAIRMSEAISGVNASEVASALNTLAILLGEQDRKDEALEVYRQVIEIRRQEPEPGPNLASNLSNLALLLQQEGQLEEADALYAEGMGIIERSVGAEHPFMAFLLNGYAGVHQDRGDLVRAREDLEQALAIAGGIFEPDHPFIGVVYSNLGAVHRDAGDTELAREYYQKALDLRERSLPDGHPDIAATINALSQLP
jgi:serine/threonine protein kinase